MRILFSLVFICAQLFAQTGTTISLNPVADNTIYEENSGGTSNGSGIHLFAGATSNKGVRRALLKFDLSGQLPEGAIISQVKLSFTVSKVNNISQKNIALHRLVKDWGESSSDAGGNEGGGAAAQNGDATWLFNFFNTESWATPGGDFSVAASAELQAANTGLYSFSSDNMIADLQQWLSSPEQNFGWIILGDESTTATALRISSRENSTADNRPKLEITYSLTTAIPENVQPISSAALFDNYPNPVGGKNTNARQNSIQTTIPFFLSRPGMARVVVYDLNGRLIRVLADGYFESGRHSLLFRADNLASGFYIYRLETENFQFSKQMLIIR
jgi:hypothetical protein